MQTSTQVDRILRAILREQMPGTEITNVTVETRYDDDGDSYLDIQVVYASTGQRPKPAAIAPLPRLLLGRLNRAGIGGFPVISFAHETCVPA
ncbi:hypothetical protein CKO28_03090 [Rhodovibrio sodomensis]|uniref:Ribosome-binding factor A n=1 Tax=Rhodovibrio sodomensis TaxID=1088 RepID=A0ABS1D9D4_9PROT|nr:hypothetical protein [Rhodovibrio sodomensis]MBK1667029.1 hypothetical protein [Rhodovibrio sodomensis]